MSCVFFLIGCSNEIFQTLFELGPRLVTSRLSDFGLADSWVAFGARGSRRSCEVKSSGQKAGRCEGEREGAIGCSPPPNSFRRGTTAESERVHPPHGTCQKDRPHRTVPYRYLLDSPLFTPILNLATSHTVVHFSVRSLCRFGLLPTLNRDVGGRTRRPSQLFGASGSRLGGASQGASGPRWRESGRFPPKPLSK